MPTNDKELDAETQTVLRNGQMIADGVKSPFWGFIKSYMLARINELDSLSSSIPDMNGKSDEVIAREFKARASAVAIMKDLVREVEATAEQHKINQEQLSDDTSYLIQS